MIWDVLIMSICTFVVLKKTNNVWITAMTFTVPYMMLRAFGDNPVLLYLIFSAGMYIYGVIIFALLKKFRDETKTIAFITVFCLGSLVMGWG